MIQLSNLQRRFVLTLVLGALLTPVGCKTTGQQRSADVADSLGATRTEIQAASQQVGVVVGALDDLVNNPQKDLKPQYTTLSQSIDTMEQAFQAIRSRRERMQSAGETYFLGWEKQASEVKSEELRGYTQERKTQAKAAFTKIFDQMDAVGKDATPVVNALRDLHRLLGLDLTAEGLKAASEPTAKAATDVKELQKKVSGLLAEIDTLANLLSP